MVGKCQSLNYLPELARRLYSSFEVYISWSVESVCTAIIRIMSLCIDIEKFPSMFAVLKEVERQRNLRIFSAMVPDQGNIHKPLTRTTTASKFRPDALNKHHNAKRQSSDPTNSRRNRLSSTPESSTVDSWKTKLDDRFTAAARKLSKEKLRLLEEYIFKPVDVFFVLRKIREETVSRDQLFQ